MILDVVPGDRTATALADAGKGSSFLDFLADPTRTRTAFTPGNWAALRAVKASVDPHNVFGAGVRPARLAARSGTSPSGPVAYA